VNSPHDIFNLSSWIEYDSGGHFPAISDPSLLAKSLRQAFRHFERVSDGEEEPHGRF